MTIRLVNEGAITIGHDVYSLGVLPVQYRPTKAISTVASGTGDGATFGLTVAKDGHVYTRSETTLSNNWARGMLTYPLG